MNDTDRRHWVGRERMQGLGKLALAGLILVLIVCASGVTLAQEEVPPESEAQPGEILLNFKDASLDAVLEYLSEVAGFVVVKEASVDGRVTVFSRQPLSAEEAVSLLNTVLKEEGYAAIRMGRTLMIVTLEEAKKRSIPVRSGNDPAQIEANDEVITQVIPIRFADAVRLKEDLAPLIPSYADLSANASSNALILTDTGANVRRIVEIVRALDTHMATAAEVRVFQLTYANAVTAARLINEVFEQEEPTRQRRGGASGMARFFGGGGREGTPTTPEGLRGQKVTASADERTNTVVVSGPSDVLAVVEKVLKDLDSNPAEEEAVFIYHVKNAQAENLETVLNELFRETGQAAGGRGGTARGGAARGQRGQTGRGGRFLSMLRQAGSQAATQGASGLSGEVYVVADADTNSLLVLTAPGYFDTVKGIIEGLDRPVPQVLIKVLIAEVTHDTTVDLGLEFSVLNLPPDERGSALFTDFDVGAQTAGLIYKLVQGDVTAALRALEEVGKLDILSRPYILASDNQPATITVGEEVPFIRQTRTTETGQTINTIQYEDIGIILNVTPHINPEGLVIMDISPEISATTGTTVPISETVNAPVFAKRSAESRVAIRDGQTIVIGGLIEDSKTETIRKVPILGDIPVLGWLFRRTIREKAKTELLIFLTPHVAQEAELLEAMSEGELARIKVVPGAVEPGAFDEHLEGMQIGAPRSRELEDVSEP